MFGFTANRQQSTPLAPLRHYLCVGLVGSLLPILVVDTHPPCSLVTIAGALHEALLGWQGEGAVAGGGGEAGVVSAFFF
jgi:hypothetical protein